MVTDLFYGQLKSKVTCQVCGHESVRFDPFNVLSLPLPMDSYTLCEVLVVRLDGQVPVRYGIRLNSEARSVYNICIIIMDAFEYLIFRYSVLKESLFKVCGVPAQRLVLTEMADSQIRAVLADGKKVKPSTALDLMAYELDSSVLENNGMSLLLCENAFNIFLCVVSFFFNKVNGYPVPNVVGPHMSPSIAGSPQEAARSPEVSKASALCMPNILCFKVRTFLDFFSCFFLFFFCNKHNFPHICTVFFFFL